MTRTDPRIATARNWPEPGRCYKSAINLIEDDDSVLDFGCGYGQGTKWLKENIKKTNVKFYKHDLNPGWCGYVPWTDRMDLIIASNVINVQESMWQLVTTLTSIKDFCDPETLVIVNYPKEPRKMKHLTRPDMRDLVTAMLAPCPVVFI